MILDIAVLKGIHCYWKRKFKLTWAVPLIVGVSSTWGENMSTPVLSREVASCAIYIERAAIKWCSIFTSLLASSSISVGKSHAVLPTDVLSRDWLQPFAIFLINNCKAPWVIITAPDWLNSLLVLDQIFSVLTVISLQTPIQIIHWLVLVYNKFRAYTMEMSVL